MKVLFTTILVAVSFLCTGFIGGFSSYTATAYTLKGRTAFGCKAHSGIIAADPRQIKLGSTVYIRAGKYSGEYVVHDTGVKGRRIDMWLPSRAEALRFGKKSVTLKIL